MIDLLPNILLADSTAYYNIIGFSAVVILSYFFNLLSKKTNIPSVLMLIVLGIGIKLLLDAIDADIKQIMDSLEILGIVGLIMIVLEASLDLELTKERWPIIWKSFAVALLSLVASALLCAVVIYLFGVDNYYAALVFAVPLSIMSSAIIIPSVGGIAEDKKEFMVYESTFSDILGIMFFFFLVGNEDTAGAGAVIGNIFINITVTIVLAGVASYILTIVFQRITTHIKLFLLIAVLLLIYSIGKLFHLSSLVIILVFGLMMKNPLLFFRGRLRKFVSTGRMEKILHDFHVLTLESAFVVRTFFFVIFGISIDLSSMLENPMSALISLVLVAVLFAVRWVFLKLFVGKDIFPQLFIAPRGLITILLFFSIPTAILRKYDFDSSILLYAILITAVIMTWSLIKDGKGLTHVNPEFEDRLVEASGKPVLLLTAEDKEARSKRLLSGDFSNEPLDLEGGTAPPEEGEEESPSDEAATEDSADPAAADDDANNEPEEPQAEEENEPSAETDGEETSEGDETAGESTDGEPDSDTPPSSDDDDDQSGETPDEGDDEPKPQS